MLFKINLRSLHTEVAEPMLDVHPPHEAAHTWKDFFIHIATICVGLLIAVVTNINPLPDQEST